MSAPAAAPRRGRSARLQPDAAAARDGSPAASPPPAGSAASGPGHPAAARDVGIQYNGVDPQLFTRMMQQQQQANDLLRQQLASMQQQLLQQQQQLQPQASPRATSISRPLPDFKGESFEGESETVETWVRSAGLQLARLPDELQGTKKAVLFLAQAFKGNALVWFTETAMKSAAPPNTPEDLFTALRKQFQPRLAAEDAFDQLRALTQGKLTVAAYTAKFRSLLALLPPTTFDATALVRSFRGGLNQNLRAIVAHTQPQPATLEELVELATRIEASSKAAGQQNTAAAMEIDSESQPGTSPALLAAIASAVRQEVGAALPQFDRREGQRYEKKHGGNKEGKLKTREIPGVLPEVVGSRFLSGKCLWCGLPGHVLFRCPDKQAGKPANPARLN